MTVTGDVGAPLKLRPIYWPVRCDTQEQAAMLYDVGILRDTQAIVYICSAQTSVFLEEELRRRGHRPSVHEDWRLVRTADGGWRAVKRIKDNGTSRR